MYKYKYVFRTGRIEYSMDLSICSLVSSDETHPPRNKRLKAAVSFAILSAIKVRWWLELISKTRGFAASKTTGKALAVTTHRKNQLSSEDVPLVSNRLEFLS